MNFKKFLILLLLIGCNKKVENNNIPHYSRYHGVKKNICELCGLDRSTSCCGRDVEEFFYFRDVDRDGNLTLEELNRACCDSIPRDQLESPEVTQHSYIHKEFYVGGHLSNESCDCWGCTRSSDLKWYLADFNKDSKISKSELYLYHGRN